MILSGALAATQTALLASQFSGGFLRIFSGAPPASPGLAETGVLLGIVTAGAVSGAGLHFDAAGEALQKSGEPWVFEALADGTVGYFRLVAAGDTGGNDLGALRIDGDVGLSGEPTDMNWESLDVTTGLHYTITAFTYFIQPVGTAP